MSIPIQGGHYHGKSVVCATDYIHAPDGTVTHKPGLKSASTIIEPILSDRQNTHHHHRLRWRGFGPGAYEYLQRTSRSCCNRTKEQEA